MSHSTSGAPISLDGSMILEGDALQMLLRLPAKSVQCVITSPPYWGMRDYDAPGQIGLEDTLTGFLDRLVAVFEEVKRVLKDDGTFWLNIGDGYTSGNRGWRAPDKKNRARAMSVRPDTPDGLKPKDMLGVPWRLAFRLQDAGWYLRSDVVWNKPNAMPESVRDRPTRSHEYLFMLTKNGRYLYDKDAVLEPNGRNRRSVWSINTKATANEHFATFPIDLILPCVLASTKPGDFILDPFFGSGTVGAACLETGREYVGIELNPDYIKIAERRLGKPEPLIACLA